MYNILAQQEGFQLNRLNLDKYALSSSKDTSYYYSKRVLDILVVFTAIVPLLLILFVLTPLIKLDSRGPVFFKQKRVGARRRIVEGKVKWELREFQCYKFRTMTHNSDQTLHQQHIRDFVNGTLEADPDQGTKLVDDPRITKLGHLLRRTSLDELPQLLNVLKGEMSLVGPRPVPTYEVAEYKPRHYERLATLPGMTGLWQIYGRGNDTFEEMIGKDIEYIRQCSLWLDIKLLLLTIPAVISGRGAA